MALTELGLSNEPSVVSWAKTLFTQVTKNPTSINPNLKRAIYFTSAFNNPSSDKLEQLLSIYLGNASPEDKIIALVAIGNLGDQKLLNSCFDLVKNKKIRLQDSVILLGAISSNPNGRALYQKWILENWKLLMDSFDQSSHMLKNCVGGFTLVTDTQTYLKLKDFFSNNSNLRDDIKLEVLQTFERIEANLKFVQKNLKK